MIFLDVCIERFYLYWLGVALALAPSDPYQRFPFRQSHGAIGFGSAHKPILFSLAYRSAFSSSSVLS